ncbi:MAG: hypothetical protein WC635_03015 [Bacteriovorax sp.]|jgi:hypothetical protein
MRFILFFCLFLLSTNVFALKTITYKAKGGTHVDFFQVYTIEDLPTGGHVVTLRFMEKNELNREHVITVDAKYNTEKWKFYSPITKLSIDAYRKGSDIILTGTKNGKKTEKKFDIGNKLWLQIFPTGLDSFALSTSESVVFCSIGIEGQGEMEIGEFIAKRDKSDREDAHLVTLTFNDWKSAFWKGKSWHRKKDGRILAIHVGRDIGTWELQSE